MAPETQILVQRRDAGWWPWLAGLLGAATMAWCLASAMAGDTLAQRRQRIESMDAEQKDRLLRRWERFQRLDPAEQERLRTLDRQLRQDPHAAELRQVMQQYGQWLVDLHPVQRAEVLRLEPGERVARIKQLRSEEATRLARRLSPEDVQVVARWLEQRAVEGQPVNRRREWSDLSDKERRQKLAFLIWLRWQSGERGRLPKVSAEDLADLQQQLSNEARQRLDGLTTLREKQQLIVEWVRQTVGRRAPGRGFGPPGLTLDPQKLREFFLSEELSEVERDRLLSLPADEMQRQLRRKYYMRENFGKGRPLADPRRPPFKMRPQPDGGRPGRPRGQPPNPGKPPPQRPRPGPSP